MPSSIGTSPSRRLIRYLAIKRFLPRPYPVPPRQGRRLIYLLRLRDVPLDQVVRDAGRRRFDAVEPGGDHRQRLGNEEEGVRLLLGQDVLDLPVAGLPLLDVEGLPSLDEQA